MDSLHYRRVQIAETPESCFELCNGTATMTIEGGLGNFQINWSSGEQDVTELSDLCPGEYSVMVTDDSRCEIMDTIMIAEAEELMVEVVNDTLSCEGEDLTIVAQGLGGAGNYTYLWSDDLGETAEVSFGPTESSVYIVLITDDNGCVVFDSVSVEVVENPVLMLAGEPDFCFGDSTQITADPFESYIWSTGEETQSIFADESGTYSVTITDLNGCTDEASIEVTESESLDPVNHRRTQYL